MSYLGTFHLDDWLGIPAATHRFSSGAAYAPTVLTYSIYEEATDTGIDEDVDMTVASPFDGIAGCYWVRRQLTTAAGFEAGKNYLVVVKATVDSVAAIQMHTFQVEAASVAQTGDNYAIVNHADYGNAHLVRSTTPNNTLDVDADGYVTLPATYDAAKTAATQASVNDVPTVSEFELRTLPSADYTIVSDLPAAAPSAADIKTALEANGSKLDHVWEMTEDDGGVRRLTANALEEAPVDGASLTAQEVRDALKLAPTAGAPAAGSVDAHLDTIEADTNELQTDWANGGRLDLILDAAGAAGDPWPTELPGAYLEGSAGYIIGNLVDDIDAIIPAVAVSSTVAATVATGTIAIRTHHTLSQTITSTSTAALNTATKLWLALKENETDLDAASVVFIEVAGGLTILAGAAYTTTTHGGLTLGGSSGAWTIAIALDEVAAGLLAAYNRHTLYAECKALVGTATVPVWDGTADVSHGIVQAVV